MHVLYGLVKGVRVMLSERLRLLPDADPDQIYDDENFAVHPDPHALIADTTIGMSSAIPIPGVLHIIHNAAGDMMSIMVSLGDAISELSSVCRFLSHPHRKPRAKLSCDCVCVGIRSLAVSTIVGRRVCLCEKSGRTCSHRFRHGVKGVAGGRV